MTELKQLRAEDIRARRRDAEDMQQGTPYPDPRVVAELRASHPRCLVYAVASTEDVARLEHAHWCLAGDWHVRRHLFYECAPVVYAVVTMED